MLPSQSNDPDAPTRLAKKRAFTGDRFKTPVYHIPETDLFITINYQIKPEPYDWVALADTGDEIVLALYDGQQIVGVVEMMEFYQLTQSEQWRPGIRNRFTNW